MQAKLAVEAHLAMQVEFGAQVLLGVERQREAEAQPGLSAEGTKSRQFANGRPDARW
jgi:hypothetical protein